MKIFLLLIILLSSNISYSADKDGKFAIKGIGNSTCDNFIKLSEQDSLNKFLYIGWINGYLTAQNQHLNSTFDLTSWETIQTLGGYLRNYCKKNPGTSFYIAVASMIHGLHEKRIQAYSAVEKIGVGEQSILIYQETLVRIQKRLKELNLFNGSIDGKMNTHTKEAIKSFQKKQNLSVTGIPDQQTLHALLEVD